MEPRLLDRGKSKRDSLKIKNSSSSSETCRRNIREVWTLHSLLPLSHFFPDQSKNLENPQLEKELCWKSVEFNSLGALTVLSSPLIILFLTGSAVCEIYMGLPGRWLLSRDLLHASSRRTTETNVRNSLIASNPFSNAGRL